MTQPKPREDECKYLLLKIIEQSIRDYLNLEHSESSVEKAYYETAESFLFDDEYLVDYGDHSMSLLDILHTVGLDLDWFREKVAELKEEKQKDFELGKSKT